MNAADILIGTSGWVFDDWAGLFFPLRVPRTKWLEYYAYRFPCGEVNATYYGLLRTSAFEGMARRTPDQFTWFVKTHSDVTHTRTEPARSMLQLKEITRPLEESGKLRGYLAQFPHAFQYSERNIEYLKSISDLAGDTPLCVEYRHASWNREDVREMMRAEGMIWVCPDEPPLQDLLPFELHTTGDFGYVRLHGQNGANWYSGQGGDRYDYLYSKEELTSLLDKLLKVDAPIKKIHVFFNNCPYAKAPTNAWWLQQRLSSNQNEPELSL